MDGPNSTIATFDHSLNILHIREPSELDHPDDPWVHVSQFHLGPKRIEAIATLIIDGALRIVMCVRRRRDRFELRVVAPGDTSGYILLQPSPIQPPFQILPSPPTELSGKAFLPLLAVASPGQLLVFSPRDEWSCICRMNLVQSGGVESTLPLPRIAWSPFVKSEDKIEGGIEIARTEETPAVRLWITGKVSKDVLPRISGSSLIRFSLKPRTEP
ncbi:BZ3500_MvSof-1268-A1-R1_Chr5-2g07884 [Microbotryum saponariae]|uniref:BZ3500_MvSof-1268-A1-R1_Chr5-2g07884 protein n=1 Tax=Microbotryum saponariae TaxID=289078 RepID=A0A2X0M1J8_9BASI|nr:BZ3500_MvSof-1268-A1-R1_Chr5-2g07884 [Microbotryum saponariae]SDA05753.1 BZ3501_MvSof-1269-A2-R1_Chr5-2g07706 [Microbotryum saponariae]